MMYCKYALRTPRSRVTPKGPSFSFARTIVSEMDGTEIRFRVPKNRSHRYKRKPVFPERHMVLEETIFRKYGIKSGAGTENWGKAGFCEFTWDFYGPWFSGVQSVLSLYGNLLRPLHYVDKAVSLYHPRAFEQAVGEYLYHQVGHRQTTFIEGEPYDFIAPVNWQPLTDLPCATARMEVHYNEQVHTGNIDTLLFFPVSDKELACLHFRPVLVRRGTGGLPYDALVDPQPMQDLIEQIIGSLEITLSAEVQAKQQAAWVGLDDTALVTEYPPIDWSTMSQDAAEDSKPALVQQETG